MGGIAVLLAFAAVPAIANAASTVVVPDACGDASQDVVNVAGNGVPVPTDRAASHDISSATLTAVTGGGVEAQIKVCGPIAAEDPLGGSWQLGMRIDDNCGLSLVVADTRTDGRQASMSIACPSVLETPVQDFYGASEVFNRTLRAEEWSVSGDTVSFHLSRQSLHVAHVGMVWNDPFAHTWDGARLTEASDSNFGVNGPGIRDDASTTATFERLA